MALAGKTINTTYKDMLNVNFGTDNEGFTSGAKRLFDGAGVGSPLYIGTTEMNVKGADWTFGEADTETGNNDFYIYGNATLSGAVESPYGHFDTKQGDCSMTWNDVDFKITGSKGKFMTPNMYMRNSSYNSGVDTLCLTFTSDGSVACNRPLLTKSTVTFEDQSGEKVVLDPATGKIGNDTDKGGITMNDDGLTVRKEDTQLAQFTDDGRFRLDEVDDTVSGTFKNGDILNVDGELYVRIGES